MPTMKTRLSDQVLVDDLHESPVDRELLRFRRWVIWGAAAIVAIVVAWLVWRFNADRPVTYTDVNEHFKYGSIGSEIGGSLLSAVGGVLPPYPIFKVLPAVCPDKLPGGYASLGLIYEGGADLPIGVSRRFRLGFDQVGMNCAVCHTGTYREAPDKERRIVVGMPAHQLDLQRFFSFVTSCTLDPRFTADNVLGEMRRAGLRLNWLDRYLYRHQVIPRTRAATQELAGRVGILLTDRAAQWGHGRVDTFNPYKALQFNWNLAALPAGELIGGSDFPSLWNQQPREGLFLHWDGNNDSVDERNLSASLGAGVTPVTIDHPGLRRVRDWIWTLPPPPYPFSVNKALAAKGAPLYQRECADCHADQDFAQGKLRAGTKVGQVEPIERIRTDPARLNSYTEPFAANQYSLYPDSPYRFTHFRKTFGYANMPLDGIWARAPYLHNGSVPTLRDLLNPPEARPKVFYRGYDVFDAEKVGFRGDVAEDQGRRFFRFDTALPGNQNGGHEYGTRLSNEDKQAIVEYLKTF